jgi:hypothetical protein
LTDAAHPERFVRKAPTAGSPPTEVWINKPTPTIAPTHDHAGAVAPATSDEALQ